MRIFLQVVAGGGVGVIIALIVLKNYFGVLPFADHREPIAMLPPIEAVEPPPRENVAPGVLKKPKADLRRNADQGEADRQLNLPGEVAQRAAPDLNRRNFGPAPNIREHNIREPNIQAPPFGQDAPAMGEERPWPNGLVDVPRMLAKAKVPEQAKIWWCQQGFFELRGADYILFKDLSGRSKGYEVIGASEQYLELEYEQHDERVHLYLDHAEFSKAPFKKFEPLFTEGFWISAFDTVEYPWLAGAMIDLEAGCLNTRNEVKQATRQLLLQAQTLADSQRVKDAPFGFSMASEREKFEATGFVSWGKPLLPITATHIEACRKAHKTIDVAYGRITARINAKREKETKAFLAFHHWRHGPWPLAIVSWRDPTTAKEERHVLLSNGSVDGADGKLKWKLNGDTLFVEIGDRRVKLRPDENGREFSVVGLGKPTTGIFLFEALAR